MRQITQFDDENRKRRIEIDLKLKNIVENLRFAASMKLLNESYYLEEDAEEKAYTKDEIKELLNNGELKLSSKIKLGNALKEFNPLYSFEEFNSEFKKFL